MSKKECTIWLLAAACSAFLFHLWRPVPLSNDSYQYLSVAKNIRDGRGVETSLVHFDTERRMGRMPAPCTTFAAGYPAAAAVVLPFTGNSETAGRIVSFLSSMGLIGLLLWSVRALRLDPLLMRVTLAGLLLNAFHIKSAFAVATEALYILTSLLAVALLMLAEQKQRENQSRAGWMLALGQLMVGLAYWARYAGLFLFAAVGVYAGLRWLLRRGKWETKLLLSCAIPAGIVGATMLRNSILVGTWRGGNDKPMSNPLSMVVGDYVRGHLHLLFGDTRTTLATVAALGLLGLLLAAGLLAAWRYWQEGKRLPVEFILPPLYVAVYSAALLYAGKTSVLSFGTRYSYPLLPIYLLAGSFLVQLAWRRWIAPRGWTLAGAAAVAVVAVVCVVSNLIDMARPAERSLSEQLREAMALPTANQQPLSAWVESTIGKNETVAAMAGQATGFMLDRPTLSLIDARYTTLTWDPPTTAAEMNRFSARYLFVFRGLPLGVDPLPEESPLVRTALQSADAVPPFRLAASNDRVLVLERTSP